MLMKKGADKLSLSLGSLKKRRFIKFTEPSYIGIPYLFGGSLNHTEKSKPSARALLLFVVTVAFFVLLIKGGTRLSDAAYDSLSFAIKKLIPSMFLFAVATGLATFLQSPSHQKKLPLLSLPSSAALPLAIGLFSGFPMGAYAARRLYERGGISRKAAEHLAAFANNASFGFLYFTVSSLFSSKKVGLLLG